MNESHQRRDEEESEENSCTDNNSCSSQIMSCEHPHPVTAALTNGHHQNNNTNNFDSDLLERFGRWLLSIPRDDVLALKQTRAYQDFAISFDKLGQAHRALNRPQKGFLQHLAVDDVLLRIFEFLESTCLIQVSQTCSRFRELAHDSASQRTSGMQLQRQQPNVMKLLRAKEQIDGICTFGKSVRVPMLGLSKRIFVQQAGDAEYNGVYYCTGTNGNGFVFTKPRVPSRMISSTNNNQVVVDIMEEQVQDAVLLQQQEQQEEEQQQQQEGVVQPPPTTACSTRPLRCIIAKRFSNETILWYMSKEVMVGGEIHQVFSFWARLMVIGDASPDICRYPSQTSILSQNGDPAWQPLSSNPLTRPPIVELM